MVVGGGDVVVAGAIVGLGSAWTSAAARRGMAWRRLCSALTAIWWAWMAVMSGR